MKKNKYTRRQVLVTTSAGVLGTMASFSPVNAFEINHPKRDKLALLGGAPIREKEWLSWPVWDKSAEDDVISMLRTGNWWRGDGGQVVEFEQQYARLMEAKYCLATSSGTTALQTALQVVGVDAGDE
ncbi:MAG: DegT/DnrJ/EryC1/StrS family aminotransferase, partial [Cyclobacteriaceae bacterium]|nr:DegT/DnrJ/EryC1/StrS family aminotransferase [Cyclobacteriaceae bacterium]